MNSPCHFCYGIHMIDMHVGQTCACRSNVWGCQTQQRILLENPLYMLYFRSSTLRPPKMAIKTPPFIVDFATKASMHGILNCHVWLPEGTCWKYETFSMAKPPRHCQPYCNSPSGASNRPVEQLGLGKVLHPWKLGKVLPKIGNFNFWVAVWNCGQSSGMLLVVPGPKHEYNKQNDVEHVGRSTTGGAPT